MAHLNLRDRVIETTIAYVGAEKSAADTFAHVQRAVQRGRAGTLKETPMGAGRVISLDWKPREEMRLNDCELTVKLVSAEPVGGDAMQDVLVDADGLVLVVDADADALERNRSAVTAVREALARAPDKKLPVVVQVNEAEPGGGQQGLEALGPEDWPRVRARTATGDGLMETLQRAVGVVVESMQTTSGPEAAVTRPAGSPRVEGNPLLAALRQMMQSTIAERIGALEKRLDERLPEEASRVTREALERLEKRVEDLVMTLRHLTDEIGRRQHEQRSAGVEVTTLDERSTKMNALTALVDELRRKKKGWL